MWINGLVNQNQIVTETASATLLKLKGSDYMVWISNKCLRRGTHKANKTVGLLIDKKYEIFRNGKGKYNRFNKVDSQQVSGEKLKERLCVG